MRKNNPLLPVTVQDQIRLWELEKNRLKSQEGYLYTAFTSPADYELVLNYAKQLRGGMGKRRQTLLFRQLGRAREHQGFH
ncbi:hypothetical protein C8R44DRAFT_340385 [Mycena epipterygia]|nr:hypothetical protein C8R44DRAFT_340385 [Mycena epipterygia]